jgi:hypothetical protein
MAGQIRPHETVINRHPDAHGNRPGMPRVSAFRAPLVLALIAITVDTAIAQSAGQFGLSIGYPSTIAFHWQVTDGFALRPEVSMVASSTETLPPPVAADSESKTMQTSLGLSGLLYVKRWEGLRTYLSPRVVYTRGSAETRLPTTVLERQMSGFAVAGSFGVQYSLADRFSVFGEAGVSHATTTLRSAPGLPASEASTRSVATRTVAGVTFVF